MSTDPTPPRDPLLAVKMEYETIRDEIIMRIELRCQIQQVSLAFAGVMLALGAAMRTAALAYPPVALLLALGWWQNDYRVRTGARYIREQLETPETGLRYEHWVQGRRDKHLDASTWRFALLSYGGVMILTQVMAVVVGVLLPKPSFDLEVIVLGGLDILSIIALSWVMFGPKRGE